MRCCHLVAVTSASSQIYPLHAKYPLFVRYTGGGGWGAPCEKNSSWFLEFYLLVPLGHKCNARRGENKRARSGICEAAQANMTSARVYNVHTQTVASTCYNSQASLCTTAAGRASTQTKTSRRLPAHCGFVSRIRTQLWFISYT